jgi:uncharacterized protein (DUF1330 family)
MRAYMIVDEDVFDSEGIADYAKAAGPTIAKYGGKALIRTTENEVLEGTWKPKRLVVLEFESKAAAKRWYDSPEYQAIIPLRQKAAKANFILVEGV